VAWAENVDRLTDGSVQIEFKNAWRIGEPDYETATIADVQVVGARAFDRVDVTSFQALLAPMLVDSHDLQAKVFEEGIPQEMLAGLEQLDLVGLGVLPGPMRKVLGVEKPFTKPVDFTGAVVGMQDSRVTELSFAALGASTKPLPSGADLDGVDAYEQQLSSIWGNHYELSAGFVTSNLNPWPRPLVLFIGKPVYDDLTDTQQQALASAADDAMLQALDASRAQDDESVADLCQGRSRVRRRIYRRPGEPRTRVGAGVRPTPGGPGHQRVDRPHRCLQDIPGGRTRPGPLRRFSAEARSGIAAARRHLPDDADRE
jgi:TRAP-type C4-dicarboxylate transport system substrate-binding protein